MKKTFYCLVGLMMVLGLVFSATPKSGQRLTRGGRTLHAKLGLPA